MSTKSASKINTLTKFDSIGIELKDLFSVVDLKKSFE